MPPLRLFLLPALPLDIIAEIFGFLLPSDLLVLARISKSFRSFLLHSSTTSIWRSARRHILDLPEPPSDMNEVQYAALVFGYGCHYHGCDNKARDTVWHLRIRSCVTCRSKHQPIKVEDSDDARVICAMLNCYPPALERYMPCGPFLSPKGKPVKGLQASHTKTFRDELSALPPSDRQAYLDSRSQATEIEHRFASAGVKWQLDVKSARIKQMRSKRAARAEIIRGSLVTTSFKEEIDYFGWDRICKHPLINSTQEITDQARPNILNQLQDYMLGWRELRTEELVYGPRRQIFTDAWLQYSTIAFYNAPRYFPLFPLPPSATIGFSETIDSIIRQSSPMSHSSLLQQFFDAFSAVGQYTLEWHRTVRRDLASLLPDYKAEYCDETIHAQLKLATSVFQCSFGCQCVLDGRTLTYPEILFHPCFTLMKSINGPSSKDPRVIAQQKASLAMGGSPWSCGDRVRLHPKQHVVGKVLFCCEKDPRSTTATEMDTQNPRLVCLVCGTRDKVFKVLTWRRAVQHLIFHPNCTLMHSGSVARHSPHLRLALQPVTLQPFPSMPGGALRDYSVCLRCPPRIPSWNTRIGFGNLIDHIQKQHNVPVPVFGRDYVFDTNITPLYLDPK